MTGLDGPGRGCCWLHRRLLTMRLRASKFRLTCPLHAPPIAGAPDLLGRRRLLDAANATVEAAASTGHLGPVAPPPYVVGTPTSTPIAGATYLLAPVGRPGCPMPTSGERLNAECWTAAGSGLEA